MCKFSQQGDNENTKNFINISKFVLDEELDIIALQEVFDKEAVENLLEYLPNWDYVWQKPESISSLAAEGYAFIWNKRRFRISTGQTKEERKNKDNEILHRKIFPKIQQTYNTDEHLYKGKLIRDPLYARFESIYGWYEIRLINTHVVYDAKNTETDSEGKKEKRRRELKILMNICRRINDQQYRNARPSYTFLLGDYNLSLNDLIKIDNSKMLDKTVLTPFKERNNETIEIITVQHQLSTLKMRSQSEPDAPANGYANNYDHFTYLKTMETDRKVNIRCERIDTVKEYWENNFEMHRKEFSDHVPIKLTVKI